VVGEGAAKIIGNNSLNVAKAKYMDKNERTLQTWRVLFFR
jgi:hypothetical protein